MTPSTALRPASPGDVDAIAQMLDATTRHWVDRPTDADPLLGALGYTAVRYFQKMVLTYADASAGPSAVPVPGVGIRGYREAADDDDLFHAFHEAFADHFGQSDADPLAWWRDRRDDPAARYDPSLWLVAADGRDRPVGFVLSRVDDDVDGTQHGFIGDVGVVPAWRRRGVGELLLRRSVADLRARGLP